MKRSNHIIFKNLMKNIFLQKRGENIFTGNDIWENGTLMAPFDEEVS